MFLTFESAGPQPSGSLTWNTILSGPFAGDAGAGAGWASALTAAPATRPAARLPAPTRSAERRETGAGRSSPPLAHLQGPGVDAGDGLARRVGPGPVEDVREP